MKSLIRQLCISAFAVDLYGLELLCSVALAAVVLGLLKIWRAFRNRRGV